MDTAALPPTAPTRPRGEPSRPSDRPEARGRDRSLDLVRAGSMFVVVAWHWVFTIVWWDGSRLRADNPIAHEPWLAHLTWLLQVMPLFFLVGGLLTARSVGELADTAARGRWVARRMRRLLVPALPVVGLLGAGILAADRAGAEVVSRTLWLTATPLWFLAVYLLVTALVPLWGPVARRSPVGHVVGLAIACVLWDLARFSGWLPGGVAWLSMLLVWLAVHQAGPLADRLRRRGAGALAGGSLAGLVVGTTWGPYPTSMVGSSADEISNMGPPTAILLALAGLQLGLFVLARPALARWAARHGTLVDRAASLAMPVYLWHMVPFGLLVAAALAAGVPFPAVPDAWWWAARPLWLVGPLVLFVPLLRVVAPRPGAAATEARAPR